MTLDEIGGQIKGCADAMNSRYGGVVFDEWAVVSLVENKARVLFYTGPRNDEFLKNFVQDIGTLRAELLGGRYGAGDFEFSRHATGTHIEVFLVLGQGIYLMCNFKARGTLEPQTHLCGRKTLLTVQRQARLQKLVDDQPEATLAELGTRLDRPFGTSTMDLWLRRLGLSYKKNAARRRATSARRGRTKGALARPTGGGARRPARVRG